MGIEMPEIGRMVPELAGMAVRGVVLLGVAGLLTLGLRRSTAALRHLVWTAALAGVLALPVLGAVVPRMGLAIPLLPVGAAPELAAAASPAAAVAAVAGGVEPPDAGEGPVVGARGASTAGRGGAAGMAEGRGDAAAMAAAGGAAPGGVSGAPGIEGSAGVAATGDSRSAASWLVGLWMAGVLALLLPLAAGWIAVRRLEKRSAPCADSRVRHLATRAGLRIDLKREFRLLMGPPGTMPMTWGIRRPVVVLPPDAARWAASRLEAVLLHELAHVRRRDCLAQLLAELVRALHWFDPLAWVAARRLRVEREHACDDVALAGGARPSSYAGELLGLAKGYRASRSTTLAAVAMARPGQLSDRLLAVLDETRRRGSIGRAAMVRTAAVVGALALVLSAAAPAAEAGEPGAAEALGAIPGPASPEVEATWVFAGGPESAAPVTDRGTTAMPEPALLQDPSCSAARDDWQNVQHQSNDDRSTIRMSRPGCDLEVLLEGDVTLDLEGMAISRLGPDARIRIEEDDGQTERYLEIRPGAGGAPTYEYRVNRREAAFDGQAQAWYRSVLLQLFRRSGFAAEERVRAILARGGVDAVLAEMDNLDSDFVQAKYFRELVRQAELSEAQYRTVIRTAVRHVESDHYLSEILKGVVEHQPLTARLLDDYVAASLALGSDHYRTGALKDVIRSGRLSGAQVAAVLESAGEMKSDHYKSELLTNVADRYALEPAFRPAYLRAAAAMSSDHYRTEVLTRLLKRPDLSSAERAEVVAAAGMIGSDHYRTEILRKVADLGLSDPDLQRAYFRALRGIDSDHYALQALRRLVSQERLPADLLRAVLEAAPDMDSDHYLSELLVEVAGRFALDGATRDAFLRAMDGIESRHYRGQVADALLRAERR